MGTYFFNTPCTKLQDYDDESPSGTRTEIPSREAGDIGNHVLEKCVDVGKVSKTALTKMKERWKLQGYVEPDAVFNGIVKEMQNDHAGRIAYLNALSVFPHSADAYQTIRKNTHWAFEFVQMQTMRTLRRFPIECRHWASLSRFYNSELPKVKSSKGEQADMRIGTVNQGCMYAAKALTKLGFKTALLNFANGSAPAAATNPNSEAGTQEEDLFKRTTLVLSLWPHRDPKKNHKPYWRSVYGKEFWGQKGVESFYPCWGPHDVIYSPNVAYFRAGRDRSYEFLEPEERCIFGVLTAASPTCCNDEKKWAKNVRSLLRVAIKEGCEALVLGAWGCGAFGNRPELVSSIFKQVLAEDEFKGAFRRVLFAVIGDENSMGNVVKPFMDAFGKGHELLTDAK